MINRSTPQYLAVATSNFNIAWFRVEAWASLTSLRHLEHLERTIRRAWLRQTQTSKKAKDFSQKAVTEQNYTFARDWRLCGRTRMGLSATPTPNLVQL